MEALEKNPVKEFVLTEMAKANYDESAHKIMVRAGCAYLIDKFGK